jgi:hypothetical protein
MPRGEIRVGRAGPRSVLRKTNLSGERASCTDKEKRSQVGHLHFRGHDNQGGYEAREHLDRQITLRVLSWRGSEKR